MSYCRWSDESDVYCYANVNGYWTVHLSRRLPYKGEVDWDLGGPEECRDFLIELKEAGYKVPQYAIDSLNEELQDDA